MEPRMAPSCSGVMAEGGAGLMGPAEVVVDVVGVVGLEVDEVAGSSPRVTTAVMVVNGRVMVWVTTGPWRPFIGAGRRFEVIAMVSTGETNPWGSASGRGNHGAIMPFLREGTLRPLKRRANLGDNFRGRTRLY